MKGNAMYVTIEKSKLEQIHEALVDINSLLTNLTGASFTKLEHAAGIAQEALAQPEQKPVAIVVARQYEDGSYAGNHLEWRGRNEANDFPEGTAFYTTSPQLKEPEQLGVDLAPTDFHVFSKAGTSNVTPKGKKK